MPENARVFMVEDFKPYQDRIEKKLKASGHTVVLKAASFEEALRLIDALDDNGVQVATIDGNLGANTGVMEGESINRIIKQRSHILRRWAYRQLIYGVQM